MANQPTIKVTSVGTEILREFLDEYNTRIVIHGGSKLLVSNAKIAKEISNRHPAPYTPQVTLTSDVTAPDGSGALQSPANAPQPPSGGAALQDDAFTHAIIHINTETEPETLRILRWVVWAIEPKGIAILICPKRDGVVNILNAALAAGLPEKGGAVVNGNDVQKAFTRDDALVDLLYQAGFERGKIRSLDRRHLTKGEDADRVAETIKAELEATLGKGESGKGWVKAYENALWSETKQHGGLLIEAQVLFAMRWDQLNA